MKKNYKNVVVSLLVALAISIIVNFAYLLSIWVIKNNNDFENGGPQQPKRETIIVSGTTEITPDGFGYLIYTHPIRGTADSVYIPNHKIRRYDLKTGSSVTATAFRPRERNAHLMIGEVKTIDGKPFEYGKLFNRPNNTALALIQIGFYALLAFIMCLVITARVHNNRTLKLYFIRLGYCVLIAVGGYFIAPVFDWHTGLTTINAASHDPFNPMVIMQCSFTLVVVALYGRTFQLLYQKGEIQLEMEKVKNEALKAQYSVLVNQINPHFLFNSLNSLAMLVREQNTQNALKYIDRLSYTFRYIIQTDNKAMVSLHDEMEFLNAYRYLLEIRYADKLFFDIRIDDDMMQRTLPALSLQPLVENAVKHNTITSDEPLTITLRTEGSKLIVSNPVRPKIEQEAGTGIGLKNLVSRWSMLAGHEVEIHNNGITFEVILPLT